MYLQSSLGKVIQVVGDVVLRLLDERGRLVVVAEGFDQPTLILNLDRDGPVLAAVNGWWRSLLRGVIVYHRRVDYLRPERAERHVQGGKWVLLLRLCAPRSTGRAETMRLAAIAGHGEIGEVEARRGDVERLVVKKRGVVSMYLLRHFGLIVGHLKII